MTPTDPISSRTPRTALGLLGVMSLLTFAGPFVLWWSLSGGAQPGWPPDRPIEWGFAIAIMGLVALLMVLLILFGLSNSRKIREHQQAMKTSKPKTAAVAGDEL